MGGVKLLTNNQSESFNATMKRLVDWKRLSIDHMENSLRMINGFYLLKIRRGRLGCRITTFYPTFRKKLRRIRNDHNSSRRMTYLMLLSNTIKKNSKTNFLKYKFRTDNNQLNQFLYCFRHKNTSLIQLKNDQS